MKTTLNLQSTGPGLRPADLQRLLVVVAHVFGAPGFAPASDVLERPGEHRHIEGTSLLICTIGGHLQGRDWIHTWSFALAAPLGSARIDFESWFDVASETMVVLTASAERSDVAQDRILEAFPQLVLTSRHTA